MAQIPDLRIVSGNSFGDGAALHMNNTNTTHHHHHPSQPSIQAAACVVAYQQNRKVIQRPEITTKLDEILLEDHRCAALWGLGGTGKTQIALDYVYKKYKSHGKDACAVFWIHAESEATLAYDYGILAAKLGIPLSLQGKDLYRAVAIAIERQPSWVLVVDNADDLSIFGKLPEGSESPSNFQEFLPKTDNGTMLWTSRDGYIAELVGPEQAINVGPMEVEEATSLLAAGLHVQTASRKSAGRGLQESNTEDGQLLLKELEYLPLAISQASAYIRQMRTDVHTYLSLLREQDQRWEVLAAHQHDRYRRSTLPNSILKTWNISVRQIQKENPLAYHILCVIAFVHHQNIPQSILSAATGLETVVQTSIDVAVARLLDFSFLDDFRTSETGRLYDMHKLVQEATQYHLRSRGSDPASNNDSCAVDLRLPPTNDTDIVPKQPDLEEDFVLKASETLTKLFP